MQLSYSQQFNKEDKLVLGSSYISRLLFGEIP